MAEHTPTPWMTHRAGEMLPNDWMIMADLGKSANGIQEVSTVARALSIRQTPETTAANAEFIVKAVNAHEAMVAALSEIVDLTVALRRGGPDPMDLQELSDALEHATNLAHDALAHVSTQTERGNG